MSGSVTTFNPIGRGIGFERQVVKAKIASSSTASTQTVYALQPVAFCGKNVGALSAVTTSGIPGTWAPTLYDKNTNTAYTNWIFDSVTSQPLNFGTNSTAALTAAFDGFCGIALNSGVTGDTIDVLVRGEVQVTVVAASTYSGQSIPGFVPCAIVAPVSGMAGTITDRPTLRAIFNAQTYAADAPTISTSGGHKLTSSAGSLRGFCVKAYATTLQAHVSTAGDANSGVSLWVLFDGINGFGYLPVHVSNG